MRTIVPFVLSTLVIASSLTDVTSNVSAFTTAVPYKAHSLTKDIPKTMASNGLRQRGGADASAALKSTGGAQAEDAPKPAKKVRISAFDSTRFFLILGIVFGHFIKFADPSEFVFRFCSQHNVLVGAFFALSGYVTAYTTTENGQRAASPKLASTPKQTWILSRVFGYYPLHLLTLLLFSPIFIFADMKYNGPGITALNGLLSVTMTQAWFPMTSEIWNAPSWFLSALTFATALMPFCLPAIATMNKAGLVKTGFWIWLTYVLPKIGYCKDFNGWGIAEGVVNPKVIPDIGAFNTQRFSPLYLAAEVFLGVIACRIVMLDGAPGEKEQKPAGALSTLLPLIGMLGLCYVRAAGIVEMSDLLARAFIFVPLFLRFLMGAHRNTINKDTVKDPITAALSSNVLVSLGGLVFPIFIAHGPIGQLFFKKLIATKLWGKVLKGPEWFAAYLAVTVAFAWIVNNTFLSSQAVKNWSNNSVKKLSEFF